MTPLSNKLKKVDLRSTVLVEKVSKILTEAILDGTLNGGNQLIEADIQKRFSISRSPIREAFRDLEKKGLVEIIPRKGTFVKRITRRDIEEHFPVRSVLEGLAAREAYRRITEQELEAMTDAFENMKKGASQNDTKIFSEQHQLFHELFINASRNNILITLLKTLRMHTMWYRFSHQYYKEDFNKSLVVHKKILKLLKGPKTKEKELEDVVRNHIAVALDRFLVYLEKQSESSIESNRT